MRGSEAIKIVGSKMFKGFDIDKEPRISIYRSVYEKFIRGLETYNTEKGVMLIGNIGVGKSVLMRIMQKLFKDSPRAFRWLNCCDLKDLLEDTPVTEVKEMYGKSLKMDLYIDDIGMGSIISNVYGNKLNIISEILIERYELFISEGFKTHVSSNRPTALDKKKYPNIVTIEEVYGERVLDRLKEMCEVITWKGESLRK